MTLANAHQSLISLFIDAESLQQLRLLAAYGNVKEGYPDLLALGEGFLGQCALEKRRLLVTDVPDDTVPVGAAALFQARPRSLAVFPIVFEGKLKAVLGLASLGA